MIGTAEERGAPLILLTTPVHPAIETITKRRKGVLAQWRSGCASMASSSCPQLLDITIRTHTPPTSQTTTYSWVVGSKCMDSRSTSIASLRTGCRTD